MHPPRSYLFVTFEGGGNVPPVLGVARRLAARGHAVRVLAEPCLRGAVEASGARFIPFTRHFTREDRAQDLIGDAAAFLQDGMDVVMELHEERAISVQLPDQVEATIVEADAVVKGKTASSSYKPAMLDNGVRVMVPPHISSGTRIVVDVYEQTYVRRAD